MSYILDALRKSDQQRRQGAAPGLMTADSITHEERPQKFSWLTVAAVLIFVTGITIGWLQAWQGTPPSPAPAVATPQDSSDVNLSAQYSRVPAAAAYILPPQSPSPARPQIEPELPQPIVIQPAAMVAQEPRPAATDITGVNPQTSIVKKEELPADIRAGLPNISVSLHAYSSKSDNRMAIVNGKTLQEGDALTPGLILERITPEDMVFTYRGYHFRQGVQ